MRVRLAAAVGMLAFVLAFYAGFAWGFVAESLRPSSDE